MATFHSITKGLKSENVTTTILGLLYMLGFFLSLAALHTALNSTISALAMIGSAASVIDTVMTGLFLGFSLCCMATIPLVVGPALYSSARKLLAQHWKQVDISGFFVSVAIIAMACSTILSAFTIIGSIVWVIDTIMIGLSLALVILLVVGPSVYTSAQKLLEDIWNEQRTSVSKDQLTLQKSCVSDMV